MRHRIAGHKMGRNPSHRMATLRNLAAGLFEHGQITTTISKAKAVQPFAEKIITLAKRGDLHSRRLVIRKLGRDRPAFTWMSLPPSPTPNEQKGFETQRERAETYFSNLPDESDVQRNRYGELVKSPKLVKHIFDEVAPRYADRPGGYTRIIKLGKNRLGDGGDLCILQLVGEEEGPEIGGRASRRRRKADKRSAYAAQARKGFAAAQPAAAPADDAGAEDEATSEE